MIKMVTWTIPKTSEKIRKSKIQSKYSRGKIKTKKLRNHLFTHKSTEKLLFSKWLKTLGFEIFNNFIREKFKNFKTGKSLA